MNSVCANHGVAGLFKKWGDYGVSIVALKMILLLLIVKVLFFVLMFGMMAFLLMLKEDKVSVKQLFGCLHNFFQITLDVKEILFYICHVKIRKGGEKWINDELKKK